MKVGAEPKKLAILGCLVLVGGYAFYSNVLSSGNDPAAAAPARSASRNPEATLPTAAAPSGMKPNIRRAARIGTGDEFRPSLKIKPEDRVDPLSIDPTLRLDLLAKVQAVNPEGGERNLFQFYTPPLKGPEPKIAAKLPTPAETNPEPAKPAGPPPPPPPAPINLKYYGYSTTHGNAHKRAFFLDGDNILVASEGDVVKKRYRVVRIGVNSVVMEDLESKHEQSLPLQQENLG